MSFLATIRLSVSTNMMDYIRYHAHSTNIYLAPYAISKCIANFAITVVYEEYLNNVILSDCRIYPTLLLTFILNCSDNHHLLCQIILSHLIQVLVILSHNIQDNQSNVFCRWKIYHSSTHFIKRIYMCCLTNECFNHWTTHFNVFVPKHRTFEKILPFSQITSMLPHVCPQRIWAYN